MTVAELIAELRKLPDQDAEALVRYHGEYVEPEIFVSDDGSVCLV